MKFGFSKPEKHHLAKSIVSDKDTKTAKLHHIHIEPASNGFVVKTSHEKPPQKGKDGLTSPAYDHDEKSEVFSDPGEAAECAHGHMALHMKHHMGGLSEAAEKSESTSPLEK